MRWMLAALVLLLSAPAAAVVDVTCPDGTRYIGTERPPCAVTCPDGGWVMPGEECRKPRSTKTESEAAATKESRDAMTVAALFLMAFTVLIYFLPTYVAHRRGHQSAGGIFVLNLLLGWTVLGWILALVWAASAVRREV